MGEGNDPITNERRELEPGKDSRAAIIGGQNFGFTIDSEERLELARAAIDIHREGAGARALVWRASGQAAGNAEARHSGEQRGYRPPGGRQRTGYALHDAGRPDLRTRGVAHRPAHERAHETRACG